MSDKKVKAKTFKCDCCINPVCHCWCYNCDNLLRDCQYNCIGKK